MELGSYFMLEDNDKIIIIDNFLPEFLLKKLTAPDRQYKKISEVYYAGETGFISDEEKSMIAETVKNKSSIHFDQFQCRLRKTREENQREAESFIHTDHFAENSAIIYLNDCSGKNGEPTGTYFWKSKITKMKEMRITEQQKMYKDLLLVNINTFELDNWECWRKIEQKTNRCVLFPSTFYHSPPLSDIEMGERITLDLFLNIKFNFQYKKREK